MEVGNQNNKIVDLGYRMIKDNIRNEIMVVKDYRNAIKLCYEYIEMVSNESEKIKNDCYLKTYYNLALCYLKLKEYENSLKYLKKYQEIVEKDIIFLADSIWLEARIYEELKSYDIAIRLYWKAWKIYKENGIEQYRLLMLKYIAELKDNKRILRKVYNLYIKYDKTTWDSNYKNYFISDDEIIEYFKIQSSILARSCA